MLTYAEEVSFGEARFCSLTYANQKDESSCSLSPEQSFLRSASTAATYCHAHHKRRRTARWSPPGKTSSANTIGCDNPDAGRTVIHIGRQRTAQRHGLCPKITVHPHSAQAPPLRAPDLFVGDGFVETQELTRPSRKQSTLGALVLNADDNGRGAIAASSLNH